MARFLMLLKILKNKRMSKLLQRQMPPKLLEMLLLRLRRKLRLWVKMWTKQQFQKRNRTANSNQTVRKLNNQKPHLKKTIVKRARPSKNKTQ